MSVRPRVLAPSLARKDCDTTRSIMARLWLAHRNIYCMYGMWYFEENTKICASGFMFIVSDTSDSKRKGPT